MQPRPLRRHTAWQAWMGTILLLALVSIILVACGSPPRIVVEPERQDLGELPPAPIHLTYTVRNEGGSPLEIQRVSTSCGCTKARVEKTTLAPGESTPLYVVLDPTEDNLTGELLRVVYVRSNDPDNPEVAVEFRVTIRGEE